VEQKTYCFAGDLQYDLNGMCIAYRNTRKRDRIDRGLRTIFSECSALNLADSRECPHCRGLAYRIRRRALDRFLSLIAPRHRFRCGSMGCGWEGNLPVTRYRASIRSKNSFSSRVALGSGRADPSSSGDVLRRTAELPRSIPPGLLPLVLLGFAFTCLPLRSIAVFAHETDQYTLPVGREFADLGPHLSRVVHSAIVEAVNGTNAAIKRSRRDTGPTNETARLQSVEVISGEVWLQLFAAFPVNESLDAGLASERMHARYPGLITAYRSEQSIYEDPLLMLDITKVVRTFARACTVNVDGKLFGTDKIIHFLNLGHIYHSTYLSARKQGLLESEAVSQAVQVSAGNNFFLSENALLGTLTTGIRSNGDLAANYAGFKFYRNLTEEVRIGNRVMPPMLVRDGPYWRLNDQVRPDSDFFTAFITPHWNEALNPNVYAVFTDARVREMLRSRCPDLLDWYRDERGRRLSREQFVAIEDDLSTWYGEPYGYEQDGESRVSIATTCFSNPPAHTHQVSAAADVARGASVDELGRTRLWWAARHGRLEEVERLLAAGENPNQMDIDGEGPLHAAARWGQVDVVEVLLSHGADSSAQGAYGMTPLQISVEQAQLGAARALLQHNANANARNLFGRSPLHDAAARGNSELVALLLQFGADPGAADDSGTTPLHLAARNGNAALVGTLLSAGANPSARNLAGATPYDVGKDDKGVLQQLTNANPSRLGHAIAEVHGHAEESGR